MHVTMEPLREPLHQTRLGRGQINPGHANLGKSKLARPFPDLRHPLRTFDLTAADRHRPIVEIWRDEDATAAFAARLAAVPALRNATIELHGDLGAGKTTLVRHLLRSLGVLGRVKSPTYAVVEPYEVSLQGQPLSIWHFDFYRFNDPREWEDAGFRDLFASPGLKLAEWPEKAAGLLPVADLAIHLDVNADESRTVRLVAATPAGQALLDGLAA
jgi:tRNA threonylcarbamoyladenosine biosynthesis protein TsaE